MVPCLKVNLNIIISLYAGKALELLELVLQTLFWKKIGRIYWDFKALGNQQEIKYKRA